MVGMPGSWDMEFSCSLGWRERAAQIARGACRIQRDCDGSVMGLARAAG
jgi:hypothetical protein